MTRQDFICTICGKTSPLQRGSVTLCVRWDTHTSGGVCAECLKAHSMEEIAAAPEFKGLLTPKQAVITILLQTAVAKSKVDPDFCIDDYLDGAGLREAYDYGLE